MCCSEIGRLPAQGRAKSCRSVAGSSPHRLSGAKCPQPTKSAGGKEYEYIVVDDYSRAVYTRPLRLKPKAPEASKIFKAAAESESQKRKREVMTDDARELNMGGMRQTCKQEGIKLHTFVQQSGMESLNVRLGYSSTRCVPSCTIRPQVLWAEAYNAATDVHNGTPYEVLYGVKPDVLHLRIWSAVHHCRAEGTVEEA